MTRDTGSTAHPQSLTPTPFVGRAHELEALQQAWQRVEAGEPQFLVWIADTGLGKTRLVQAFYEWLSTHRDAREPDAYWPDSLDIAGRTLAVNPEFKPTDGARPDIPWLWWGLRFTDTRYERGIAASSCGLVNAKEHLQPHLEPLVRARHGRELTTEAAKTTVGIWANLFSVGIVGTVFDGVNVYELDQERRKLGAPLPGIAEQQADERHDAVEDLLALFRDLLGRGIVPGQTDRADKPRKRPIPCALILDDAHWADVDTLRFVEALYLDALRDAWPLLLLCTHWEKEWNLQGRDARTPNAGTDPRSIADVCERIAVRRGAGAAGCCKIHTVPRLPDPDLRPVLIAGLPGITNEQADALLTRVGGNPGFLVDLIAYARTDPMLFAHRDPTGPLTADGFADLRETAELDHQDLIRKRFRELDDRLRGTLTLASYQGVRFLDDLLLEAAARLDDVRCSVDDLSRARHPHAIIERASPEPQPPASEFRQRAWYEVANRQLDKAQYRSHKHAFADQLRQVLTDWRTVGRTSALDPRDQILALNLLARELGRTLDDGTAEQDPTLALLGATLADLVELRQAGGEPRQAAAAARELVKRMPQGGWPADQVDLYAQFAAANAAQEFTALSDALALHHSSAAGFEAAGHRTGLPKNQNDLAGVYQNRGGVYANQGDIDAAIADFSAAIGIREALRTALGEQWPPAMQHDLAAVYANRGAVRRIKGDLDGAIADYGEAMELREALRTALGEQWTPAMQKGLATVYSNRGAVRRAQGDLDGAIADYGEAMELQKALRTALGEQWPPEMRNDLAEVFLDRGRAYADRDDLDAAIADYDEAIKLREALRTALGEQWPPMMQHDLAAVFLDRGLAYAKRDDLDAAIADYDEAIKLREALRTTLGEQLPPAMKNDLAAVYANRGDAHLDGGDPDAAIADYSEAIGLREALRTALGEQWSPEKRNDLAADPWAPTMQNELAAVYANRGDAHLDGGDPDAAIADYSEAIGLREALRTALGEQWSPEKRNDAAAVLCAPTMQNELATVYENRGNVHLDGGDPDAAIADYSEAIGLWEALRTGLGEQLPPETQNDLAAVYAGRGDAHANSGDLDAAIADYDEAIKLREALRTTLGEQWTPEMQNNLAAVYLNRGNACADRGDLDFAIADYGEAMELQEALRVALGEQWTPEMQKDLAAVYAGRGDALAERGDLDAAIVDYGEAIGLGEALRRTFGEQWPPEMQKDLAAVYAGRGNAHANGADLDAAIGDYDKEIGLLEALRTTLGEQWPPEMQNVLAAEFLNRGSAYAGRHDLDAAIADYGEAIGLWEGLRRALGDQWAPEMQNSLARSYINLGAAYGNGSRLTKAIAEFERAIAILRPLVDAHPQIPDWRDNLELAEQYLAHARRLAADDAGD